MENSVYTKCQYNKKLCNYNGGPKIGLLSLGDARLQIAVENKGGSVILLAQISSAGIGGYDFNAHIFKEAEVIATFF